MATPSAPRDSFVDRSRRWVGRSWGRAKYQWFNASLLKDVSVAVVLFLFAILVTFALPKEPSPLDSGAKFIAASFASLPPLLLIGSFWRVRSYLKDQAAFEDLRAGNPPVLPRVRIVARFNELMLQFPCAAVVIFAIFTGLALGAWGIGGWGPAVRINLMQVATPLPPVAIALRWFPVEEDVPWPGWIQFGLSALYSYVVIALVAAWFERGNQRQNFVASLFTEEDRTGSEYGFRSGGLQREPHEQVLLEKGERIGAACLPYLRVELAGPEWTTGVVASDRCRGAVAALDRVFGGKDSNEFDREVGKESWQAQPMTSDWIADWLLTHLGRLLDQDLSLSHPASDHRLAEAVRAVAAVLASGQSFPPRLSPTTRGARHDPERARKFLDYLKDLFLRAPKRPVLLLAACDAADRLGTREALDLLDKQTRNLDVQAGYTVAETDRILQTRDRVLAREPQRSERIKRLIQRTEELKMERLPTPEGKPMLFRRPKDGAVMVLVVGGSFCRGDNYAEKTSPKKRVHLSSYLIDIAPVSQESFTRWITQQKVVLRVERGFYPVQGLPNDFPQDHSYASHVTWFAAQGYAQSIIAGGHLPTEAQWEKAARGSEDDRRYPCGETWMDEPVSPFGVRVCHLLEWTQDAFDHLAYKHDPRLFDPRMDPVARAGDEAMRTSRGRTPDNSAADYRLVERQGLEPVTGAFTAPVGFRVVVDLEPEARQ